MSDGLDHLREAVARARAANAVRPDCQATYLFMIESEKRLYRAENIVLRRFIARLKQAVCALQRRARS